MSVENVGVTSSIVKIALDAALLRHQVLANNIANAKTVGYKRQSVEFERLLTTEIRSYSALYPTQALAEKIGLIKPKIIESELSVKADNDSYIQLDQEVAKMTKNVIHYQALIAGLGKRGSILKTAVTGGR